jgi:hypothetical protein
MNAISPQKKAIAARAYAPTAKSEFFKGGGVFVTAPSTGSAVTWSRHVFLQVLADDHVEARDLDLLRGSQPSPHLQAAPPCVPALRAARRLLVGGVIGHLAILLLGAR